MEKPIGLAVIEILGFTQKNLLTLFFVIRIVFCLFKRFTNSKKVYNIYCTKLEPELAQHRVKLSANQIRSIFTGSKNHIMRIQATRRIFYGGTIFIENIIFIIF